MLPDLGGPVVGWQGALVAVEFARPADTLAYAVDDAVANSVGSPTAMVFTPVGLVAGSVGKIVGARLFTDQSTNVAQFRLFLFNANPTPIPGDNTAFPLRWADRTLNVAQVSFPAMQTEGAGSTMAWAEDMTLKIPFQLAASGLNLFGLLETLTAFTPASAQGFRAVLLVDLP